MASSSLFLLLLLCCFSLLISIDISSSVSASPTSITIPLNKFNKNPPSDPFQKFTHLASASLTRAKHLKNPPKKGQSQYSSSSTPLSAQSYGGYSISLSFGTPPQTIPFVLDTGSDLVWFPCTHRYLCKNCSFSHPDAKIPSFIPKMSSSSKLVGCQNPKCGWIHKSRDAQSRCSDCDTTSSNNCTQICPPYLVIYGSGSTGGILLTETLDFPGGKNVPNFAVGCSLFSSRSPAGIAGFGRGPSSLPAQLRLSKFSYCLLSHRFDDSSKTSSLILDGGPDSGGSKTAGFTYTPILKSPVTGKPEFSVYYYVGLRKITVGGKHVKVPNKYLSPGPDGNGGAIVDSGSTFTFMEGVVFGPVAREIVNQTVLYKRVKDVEERIGLGPCFDVSGDKKISVPKLVFHFKGGADMELPLPNYFAFVDGSGDVVCMTIVTDGAEKGASSVGPAVILGNHQMQNFNVEYDLKNERFGFRKQVC